MARAWNLAGRLLPAVAVLAWSAPAAATSVSLQQNAPGHWSAQEAPLDAGAALRFYGNGAFEENQVKIRIDAPAVPADLGTGDFTLEFWMKALPGQNPAGPCSGGGSDWINGDIVFDRDVFGNGDFGDYGVSIANGRVVWGVGGADAAGYFENTLCGTRVVTDGAWHHVAVTRGAAAGLLRIFVDGQLDAQGAGPDGDTSYRNGRPTSYPNSDPFLVIGAEKHFGANGWNGYSGWIDEVRLSSVARYTASFTRPAAPFVPDAATRALYHFDEGSGNAIGDVSGAPGGPSNGVRLFGGSPAGPVWVVSDAPLSGGQTITLAFTQGASSAPEAGTAGAAAAVVTSNGAPTASVASVQYAAAAGTAAAGADFSPTAGTLTFPAGTASGSSAAVGVPLVSDTLDEDDETFTLALSNPAGAVLGSQTVHTWTILDDDPLPSLSTGDCATSEGDAGTTPCTFTMALAPASGRAVTAAYATAGGSATSGSDFQPAAGVLTFPAGTISRGVSVAVAGDTTPEPDESFALQLSSPSFALLGDALGTGTILDDDAAVLPGIELVHGAALRADLAGGAPDLYRISQPSFSSLEVVVDEGSGDAGLVLERLAADGATVLQTAPVVGAGTARSLRWVNPLAAAVTTQYVRVRATQCSTDCGPDDTYRIRAYETTGRIARFNNSGSQATVLLLQNTRSEPVSGHAHFWLGDGTLLVSQPFALGPRAVLKFDTFQVPAFLGQTGAITVTHDAAYGGLAGKAALIETLAGFTFDAPLTTRPR